MNVLNKIGRLKEIAIDVKNNAKTRSLHAVLPDVGKDRMRIQLMSAMMNNIEKNCQLALKGKRDMPTVDSVIVDFHKDESFVAFCNKEVNITDEDVKGIAELAIAKFKDKPIEKQAFPSMPKVQPCPTCHKKCKINLRLENGAKYLCYRHGEFEVFARNE